MRRTASHIQRRDLDKRPRFRYKDQANLAHVRDAIARVLLTAGASAVPACGPIQSAPGQLRASCWPALRPVREVLSLDWDRRARVTPVEEREACAPRLGRPYRAGRPAASQETWPEVAPAGREAQRLEPRWNADRRAHPSGCAPHRKMRRLGNTFVGVPPPFFLFASFVIAGQKARSAVFVPNDPAIHAERKPIRIYRWVSKAANQYGPPGQAGGERSVLCWQTSGAIASRGCVCFIPPRCARRERPRFNRGSAGTSRQGGA